MGEPDTMISCDMLSNMLNEFWMDVTQAETIQEIELKIDMLEGDLGRSLGPCIGYEVLNDKTGDYDSVSFLLNSLKSDAKSKVHEFYRSGKHTAIEGNRITETQKDRLVKHIDQLGKDKVRNDKSNDGHSLKNKSFPDIKHATHTADNLRMDAFRMRGVPKEIAALLVEKGYNLSDIDNVTHDRLTADGFTDVEADLIINAFERP